MEVLQKLLFKNTALYKLKHAPKVWFKRFDAYMINCKKKIYNYFSLRTLHFNEGR
jgi:hypothetical protein